MHVQRTRHTRAYVQIPNVIARSSTLSLEAVGLLVRLLSLPDVNKSTVEGVTSRVPNGRRVVGRAMNELVEAGYVQRARVQDPETGRWVTLTSVSDQPTDQVATVGEAAPRSVGGYPKGKAPQGNDLLPEPRSEEQAGRADDSSKEEGEISPSSTDKTPGTADAVASRAVLCLAKLGQHERRLRLTPTEVQRLAPLAAAWLSEGFHEMEVITALGRALPASIDSAAALVTFRLKEHRPEPPTALVHASQPAQKVTRSQCSECRRPFRLGVTADVCRDCRKHA
ncbi:hypothetical protein [Streptomyces sp. H27-H5]|uniref:hypothetical protein n=1 Tax=Streptomyces sp. H27-H5 TaxID=2996460 RepID=UPI0022701C96|nr:hypothetical protein [Streptomyces sp. H27-H5]MCY0955839.1 hypothetical protein [Streptomyces sp. H27-H5]